ncbi:MAG: hypothetical protein LBU14_06295 [Candidatus Peribacteria bacterium]|nr:hypothetical protein [Candidatus Peribacteria bacterium]
MSIGELILIRLQGLKMAQFQILTFTIGVSGGSTKFQFSSILSAIIVLLLGAIKIQEPTPTISVE